MVMLKSILLVFIVFCFLETIQLGWSANGSNLNCPQNERNALLDFKQGLIDQTNRLSSWVGQDCCKWKGVSCNNFTGHVVRLDLRNPFPLSKAGLTAVGEVNPSLLELKHLNYLDLSWNNFSGIAIPKFFGLFHELTYLNLSTALFGGMVPLHLGNLSKLHSLDLSIDYLLSEHYYNLPSLVVDTLHWTSRLLSLRHLVMSGIYLSNIPPDSFQAISSFPSLLELRLSYCGLYKISKFFYSLENLTSLTILDLSGNNIQGPIPSAIWNMTSLKSLDLAYNKFSSAGSILDEMKNLKKLEVLGLSFNSFEGEIPTSLTKLSALQVLDLGSNFFSGQIPTSIGRMSALSYLSLGSNQFSGNIPVSLGKLSNLETLSLGFNQFNGTVPESLGQLSQLTFLDIRENQFHGVVSELHFARLSKLNVLDLSMNYLSIKIRSGWVPPFQLNHIRLGSCNVGPRFPDWLQTQTGIEYLDMSNSGILYSIPNWFQNLTSLDILDLTSNQIYGKLSNLINSTIGELYLSSNKFEGSLPQFSSDLTIMDLSNNKIVGPIPVDIGYSLLNLIFLSLSNNSINGAIPNSICKMFFLGSLDLSNNNLSGVLPHCLGDLTSRGIDLTSNNLSGTIPSSFCHTLGNLESLHLSKNNFHGELSASLQNCTSLSILDVSDNKFSGEIPTWIGYSLISLRILKLSSNKYNGNLSPKLCRLNKLQVLDIAGNNISGNIPSCFGNFHAMLFKQTDSSHFDTSFGLYEDKLSQRIKGRELEYTKTLRFVANLDLSNNNFVGHIPEQLTNLSGLNGLNLSRNHLTGSIPKKIGQMRSLESLDLSNNHLSGTIPQSISALTSISHLDLSNNNLSGPIPSGYQLQTLNDSFIYNGNSELCGPPLEKKCTEENDRKGKGENNGDGDEFITTWFYIGMVTGCVVGFWGFCCVLLLKKTWRYAYFRFVDDIHDWLFFTVAARKVGRKRN